RKPGRDQQGADIERIARVGVGTAGGELLILCETSRRPAAQQQTEKRHRQAPQHRLHGGLRPPGEDDDDQEAAGDAQPGDDVGVWLGEHRSSFRISKTRSGVMDCIDAGISRSRLYVVAAVSLRNTRIDVPYGPLRAGSVGPKMATPGLPSAAAR